MDPRARHRSPSSPIPTRRGAVLVLVAILMTLVILLVGLALDAAAVRKSVQELQAAADSSALAAASVLADDTSANYSFTRQEAIDAAAANRAAGDSILLYDNAANADDGDIVVGLWDRPTRVFTPTTTFPDAVLVRARRTSTSAGGSLNLLFGSFFGATTSDVSRPAIARYGGGLGAAVIILHPTLQSALDLRGTAEMLVPNDGVQVNSSHVRAFTMNGAPDVPRLRARRVNVHGNYRIPSNSCVPEPVPNSPTLPDPLAHLTHPDPAAMTNYGAITSSGTYNPGYYPGGVNFNSGTAHLNPGVYYFGPPGIDVHADAVLEGTEVMLFIGPGGSMQISGNFPGLTITPPRSGEYEGVCVFQHRSNTNACDISGGGTFEVGGTMYLPTAHLEMDGNVIRRVGSIVVYTQLLRGTATYIITGEGPHGDTSVVYLVK